MQEVRENSRQGAVYVCLSCNSHKLLSMSCMKECDSRRGHGEFPGQACWNWGMSSWFSVRPESLQGGDMKHTNAFRAGSLNKSAQAHADLPFGSDSFDMRQTIRDIATC